MASQPPAGAPLVAQTVVRAAVAVNARSAAVTPPRSLCDTRADCGREMGEPMAAWQVWALLAAAFAALTAIFAKLGVQEMSADAATLIRTLVIVCVLAAVVIATRQLPALTSGSPRTYLFLVLSGLATGASWWCYFRALQLGDAARVAPLDKLSVVLVAVFGVTVLGERLAPVNWLGILMVAAGAWLVALRL
jgi:bacterial/archaeal transporter family protein